MEKTQRNNMRDDGPIAKRTRSKDRNEGNNQQDTENSVDESTVDKDNQSPVEENTEEPNKNNENEPDKTKEQAETKIAAQTIAHRHGVKNNEDKIHVEDNVDKNLDMKIALTPSDEQRIEEKKQNDKNISAKSEKLKEETDTHNHRYRKFVVPVVAFLSLLAIYIYMTKGGTQIQPVQVRDSVTEYKLLHERFEIIKSKYPAQTTRFWKVLRSQTRRLLVENTETYPAVVLIAVPTGQSETGTCLANDVVQSLNEISDYPSDAYNAFINLKSLSTKSAPEAKLQLDKGLQTVLDSKRGVVLDHIEVLDANVVLLLHGYCDGDYAPYKNSAIFLVLHTSQNSTDLNEVTVNNICTELWERGLGKDEFPALMSRIANNIAILKTEDNFSCDFKER